MCSTQIRNQILHITFYSTYVIKYQVLNLYSTHVNKVMKYVYFISLIMSNSIYTCEHKVCRRVIKRTKILPKIKRTQSRDNDQTGKTHKQNKEHKLNMFKIICTKETQLNEQLGPWTRYTGRVSVLCFSPAISTTILTRKQYCSY